MKQIMIQRPVRGCGPPAGRPDPANRDLKTTVTVTVKVWLCPAVVPVQPSEPSPGLL